MYSTFHGLEVGKRAILSQQTALTVTGHNIANANTKGYTRQEAVLGATTPLSSPGIQNGTLPMQLGTGVEVSEFRRIREGFLDKQFQNLNQEAGKWDAKSGSLSALESIFNDLSDGGLDGSIQRFWQSLQELAKRPDDLSARVVAAASGKEVADRLNQIHSDIGMIETSIADQLSVKANEINTTAKEIASLNLRIAQVVAGGNQPNDLLDKRDLLLDKLSRLVDIEADPGPNGQVNVLIGGSQLINGGNLDKSFAIDPITKTPTMGGAPVTLKGGEVQGLLETHGYTTGGTTVGTIPALKTKLDDLAKAIADSINGIHASDDARSLEYFDKKKNDPTVQPDKLLFFVDKNDPTQPPSSADSIMVNPLLKDFPAKIAAAAIENIGDGSNAKAMSDMLQGKLTIGGTIASVGDYYKTIIGDLGTDIQAANNRSANANAMVQQTENQRQSISGVSIDEELTNMVRYQQAYNAAARYVSAVNDMLNVLINGMK
ncbi:flagellar hook-associated protein FlgK [Neobacillus piezotolerans]|uniref:Flagellar hook-associated protein 1 n=1 Tax=Neobacillus piezotolerans TaxID=2259171 RepID=A0A3D8GNP9_9BACI|nr:flagellar hook-associated protein FlgK [Neobacillus piezotolerans]RDU35912.1 flagellar hook-associated protein FlgK [Neobacillus piezotolerans]